MGSALNPRKIGDLKRAVNRKIRDLIDSRRAAVPRVLSNNKETWSNPPQEKKKRGKEYYREYRKRKKEKENGL